MKLIAHRGNLYGSKVDSENKISYIEEALQQGFDAEIDLHVINNQLFLGHDEPQYPTTLEWLTKYASSLWIHCKNREALELLSTTSFNYFWHQTDDYTITSQGFGWVYPGIIPYKKSVLVISDLYQDTERLNKVIQQLDCYGICSDEVGLASTTYLTVN